MPDTPDHAVSGPAPAAESAGAQARLGSDYRRRGQAEEALQACNRTLALQPGHSAELDRLSEHELTLLRTNPAGRILLDKLPLNLIELGLVHRLFPNARVVVALRDPRDCCLSCFMRGFVPNHAMIHFATLGQTARLYAAVMDYWLYLRAFLPQPWLEVRYEEIVGDFEGSARRLLEFLELEWSDAVLSYHEQAGRRDVRTPSYGDVSQPIFTRAVGRWRNYAGPLSTTQECLQPFVRAFGYATGD